VSGTILIRGLRVAARVGVPDEERREPQELELDLELRPRVEFESMADRVEATIDYDAVCRAVAEFAAEGEWRLIETLAAELGGMVRSRFGAEAVMVEVRKFILPQTRWVGVRWGGGD